MLKREVVRLENGRSWQILGGGSGPALVWLHGLNEAAADDALLATLAERHRIVAPLAPGFADLDELSQIDTIHDLALDYDDLLDGLRLDAAILAGHSFGAMVAAEIAAHFPRRAARLVLLSPLGLWNDAVPVADLFAVPVAEMDRLLWQDMAARDAFRARLAAATAGMSVADRTVRQISGLTSIAKFIWPIPDKGLRKRLKRIAAPTLALFGAEDRVVPPHYAEDFGAGLRRGRMVVVPGAGHMLPYEKPGDCVALIEKFLSEAE